jgi:hypothetical protein
MFCWEQKGVSQQVQWAADAVLQRTIGCGVRGFNKARGPLAPLTAACCVKHVAVLPAQLPAHNCCKGVAAGIGCPNTLMWHQGAVYSGTSF